jgi:hypothetical protein
LVESTFASNAPNSNASIVAKNFYGNLQFMQWQNLGARIGSRVTANGGAGEVAFTVGNDSEQMRLTSTGLGIGTSSPAYKLHVVGGNATGFLLDNGGQQYTQLLLQQNGTINTGGDILVNGTAGTFSIRSLLAGPMIFATSATPGGATERARIDSSGNLLVGTTSALTVGKVSVGFNGTNNNGIVLSDTVPASGVNYALFQITGTTIGSIARVAATSAVVYNTTSDYRLKTVVGAVTGHGERIDALKPIDYQWKESNAHARGFLAYEFQEVYAHSVTGTKDAVDADGNPAYQSMQAGTSEVIADLVAEIQSLRKRLTALESKETS